VLQHAAKPTCEHDTYYQTNAIQETKFGELCSEAGGKCNEHHTARLHEDDEAKKKEGSCELSLL